MLKLSIQISAILLLVAVSNSTFAKNPVNGIVAVVDQGVILRSQLDDQVKQMFQRLPPEQRAAISRADIEKRVLDRMIITEIQLQIAQRSGFSITAAEIDVAIGRIAKANELTPEKFREVLRKDGITTKSIRDQILVKRIQASFVRYEVKVSEQETNSFLKLLEQNGGEQASEYHIGHILISTPKNATLKQINEARLKANSIIKSLSEGQKFSTLSIAHSDSNNALEGGDLGWLKLAQMPSLLTPYVDKLQSGGVSRIIQSPSGFHIVKLFETRGQQKFMITKTHVRHILLKINALVNDKIAQERLLSLKQRIDNGEDFANLARGNSEDRSSAIRGGSLNWVHPGSLVPAFESAMNKLAINEISFNLDGI